MSHRPVFKFVKKDRVIAFPNISDDTEGARVLVAGYDVTVPIPALSSGSFTFFVHRTVTRPHRYPRPSSCPPGSFFVRSFRSWQASCPMSGFKIASNTSATRLGAVMLAVQDVTKFLSRETSELMYDKILLAAARAQKMPITHMINSKGEVSIYTTDD